MAAPCTHNNRFVVLAALLTATFALYTIGAPAIAQAEPIDPELRVLLRKAAAESDSFADRFHAEVWLTDMSGRLERFIKDDAERLNFLRVLHREAQRARIPPEIVLAVIEVESRFDRFALSHAGAQGMMQVMPFWKYEIGRPEDNLFHLETNLRYGSTILKHYLDKSNGALAEALARYNGSYGSYRYSEKVMDALYDHWR